MIIMRRFHSFRGSRRGNGRPIVQSFKMVVNDAPASVAAGVNNIHTASAGTENAVVGQATTTSTQVPTGAVIKYIEWQLAIQNLVNVAAFAHVAIQQRLSGQGNITPNVVGGNPLRSQVFHQELFCVGQNQNVNRVFKFKVPKSFQRVKDGAIWQLVINVDQVSTQVGQTIYKFYR